jgi:acyl carrier protein
MKADVVKALAGMITDVVGDEVFEIEATSSFKDDLAFQSIQFVALAELIQERWSELDFVGWITAKAVPEMLALQVGDVADFIVASSG